MKVRSELPEIKAVGDAVDCCPLCEEREHLLVTDGSGGGSTPIRSPEGNALITIHCSKCSVSAMAVAREPETTAFKLKKRLHSVYHHRIYRRLVG